MPALQSGGIIDQTAGGAISSARRTPDGWLMIYHGVRHTASGSLYRLGLALFDLERPEICLARGDSWIFGPEATYERHGDVANVAFPCGLTIGADGGTVSLYYGRHEHRDGYRQHSRLVALACSE